MQLVSAVILAGGRSSRMGSNKALLKLDDQSIIQAQVDELAKFYQQIVIVSNQPELYSDLGVMVVRDDYPGLGPLAGIHAGLKAAAGDGIFVIPCDMPFIPGDLGTKLLEMAGPADGVVLKKDDHLEPLCALYSKNCLGVIEEFLSSNRRKVIDFYPLVNIKIVPVEELGIHYGKEIFFNINTPEDFQRAINISGSEKFNPIVS